MSDRQSRGQKHGGNDPHAPESHQTAHASPPRPESARPFGQALKPKDRPKDDPSEAPESGTRDRPE